MQLIFHGGASEVGRSCVELRTGPDRYLLDCGVKFHKGGMDYPAKVFESRAIDGVFLSHAHLDHCGGLPFFEHYHMHCPIFATRETRDMAKTLLKDSWRIAHIKHVCEPYEKVDMVEALKDMVPMQFNKKKHHRTITYSCFNAGHIPGSYALKVECEGLNLLYTGDYNTVETALMKGADPEEWGNVDILITEATYGVMQHPDRKQMREALLNKVEEVVKRGGRVVLPVFAVGRAQEILIMLADRKWDVPIYMDGMARKITRSILNGNSPYVRDRTKMKKTYEKIKVIGNFKERERVADHAGIFITTSGMLQGGPVMGYMDHIYNDKKSAVLLTGYQVKHTNGWYLDQENTWRINGKHVPVKCEVKRYDFSAHLSRKDIEETIRKTNPRIIIFMHGDPTAIAAMRDWAKVNTKALVYTPAVGDQIDIGHNVSHMHAYDADDGYEFPEEHQHGDTCWPASEHVSVEDDD